MGSRYEALMHDMKPEYLGIVGRTEGTIDRGVSLYSIRKYINIP